MALAAGTKLGPYEILAPLGAGGMGEVYHARDTRLQREVAIKVLPEHLSTSPEARQRLEREARSISRLSHPHICTLYDIGREDDHFFLVIEYLQGETLAERLKKGPLPLPELLTISTQIADALDQAHRQGLIHRDLKPANIMLTRAGAKLLDFGLAKATDDAPAGKGEPDAEPALDLTATPTRTSPLTVAGSIVGTFQYMAPEILEGHPADTRSDIFSFGTVLYEMAMSPDGRFLALSRDEPDSESFDIWTYDLARDIFTRITFDGNGDDPAWSPDGKWIAYAHGGDLYRKRASGAGADEELFSSTGDKVAHDWSRDGKTILFAGVGSSGAENLWVLPLEEGGEARPILDGPYRETHGQFSPDGKLLAYTSSESGTLQVYLMSWPDMTEKWQVSRDGGGQPRWREDSHALYYLALDGTIIKTTLSTGPDGLIIGDPQSLFQLSPEKPVGIRTHQYAALPGDKGFVVIQDTPATEERTSVVTLVTGAWD